MRIQCFVILLAAARLLADSIAVEGVKFAPQNRFVLTEQNTLSVDSATVASGVEIKVPDPTHYASTDGIRRTIEVTAVDASGKLTLFEITYGPTPPVVANRRVRVKVDGGVPAVEAADGKPVSRDGAEYARRDATGILEYIVATDAFRALDVSASTWSAVPAGSIAPLLGMPSDRIKQASAKFQGNSAQKTTLLLRVSTASSYGAQNDMEMTGIMVIDPKWASLVIDLNGAGRTDKSAGDAKLAVETKWHLQVTRQLQP